MLSTKKIFLLLTSLIMPASILAQSSIKINRDSIQKSHSALSKTIKGSIVDALTGAPIFGASISYLELSSAISDSSGQFSIQVPNYNITIRIQMTDYEPMEVPLKERHLINVKLEKGKNFTVYSRVQLPHSSISRSNTTFAVSQIKNNQKWSNSSETPDDFLQGKISGLYVTRHSGNPGTGSNMFLRGISSLYSSNQPLIVIDGVIYNTDVLGNSLISGFNQDPLSYIDTKDIDNVTVIRDGSALYGSKGANGVILITTTHAKQEATHIDFAAYGSINLLPKDIPVMDANEYRIYLSELLQTSSQFSDKQIEELTYLNNNKTDPDYYRFHQNTNWQNLIFNRSYAQNEYLRISGGDNIATYVLSMGFLNNKGIIQNTGLHRYSARFNADLNISKRLKVTGNFSFSDIENKLQNTGINYKVNPIYSSLVKAPFLASHVLSNSGIQSPILADADSFGISNPEAIIEGVQANSKGYNFMGSANFKYESTKNFYASALLAIIMDKARESFFIPQNGIVSDTLDAAIAKNSTGANVLRRLNVYSDIGLHYKRTFKGTHNIAMNMGMRYMNNKEQGEYGLGYNTPTDQYVDIQYGNKNLQQIGGDIGEFKWIDDYFNLRYNYLEKYFATLNVSVDGSSRFGENASNGPVIHSGNKNYPIFPSLSAAWLISSERFMLNYSWINLLKLRGSIGLSGNDDIGDYTAQQYYSSQNLLNAEGLIRGNIPNPDLQWESVRKADLGIDLALINEMITVSFDVYKNKTSSMIVKAPPSVISGMQFITTNSGAMKTDGWEINTNFRLINNIHLKWYLGADFSHYNSIVTKLPDNNIITNYAGGSFITKVGYGPNLFYGYKTDGIFTSNSDASKAKLANRNPEGTLTAFTGGDIHFVDLNGDHIIDSMDRTIIGNPNPKYFGGITTQFNWKNWTLNALGTFSIGNSIYNFTRRQLESMNNYSNQTKAIANRWMTNGQITKIPRAVWGDPVGNARFSSRWIENGSYLRLQTISLSYQIPINPSALRYMYVYLTGNNLITLTHYLGYDPEFSPTQSVFGQGTDIMLEPQYRSIQLGIRLGF